MYRKHCSRRTKKRSKSVSIKQSQCNVNEGKWLSTSESCSEISTSCIFCATTWKNKNNNMQSNEWSETNYQYYSSISKTNVKIQSDLVETQHSSGRTQHTQNFRSIMQCKWSSYQKRWIHILIQLSDFKFNDLKEGMNELERWNYGSERKKNGREEDHHGCWTLQEQECRKHCFEILAGFGGVTSIYSQAKLNG